MKGTYCNQDKLATLISRNVFGLLATSTFFDIESQCKRHEKQYIKKTWMCELVLFLNATIYQLLFQMAISNFCLICYTRKMTREIYNIKIETCKKNIENSFIYVSDMSNCHWHCNASPVYFKRCTQRC